MKKKYLNNKDLLQQIHQSKNSFCWFNDPQHDHQYDIILDSLNQIDQLTINKAKANKSARIQKDTSEYYNPDKIATTDLVFRVMTYEHVPLTQKLKKQKILPSSVTDYTDDLDLDFEFTEYDEYESELYQEPEALVHVRCNFPPFKHYKLSEKNVPYVVGISHWKGDSETGEFCTTHGKMTEELGKMFIMLCKRYGTKSNWNGYTYNDEMQGQALVQLCQFGLLFNEHKSQNPFAYFTQILKNSFVGLLNTEKRMQNIRDDIMEQNGLTPSFTRQFNNTNKDAYFMENPD